MVHIQAANGRANLDEKSNGGKQRKQKDTVIPMNNLDISLRGKVQLMTTDDGKAKGLEQTLRECGFNVTGMRAKCSPVCPWENENCCMACLLSKQDDFVNQISMLETVITEAGHKCLFLPKFHCELNPIEMVCHLLNLFYWCYLTTLYSIGDGQSIAIVKLRRRHLKMQRKLL